MNTSPDLLFIEHFFRELQRQGISYCILRNVDEVICGDAHDVDMTVDAECLQKVEDMLSQSARKLGWRLHLKTGSSTDKIHIKCYNYYLIDEQNQQIRVVHIDIFPSFTWKGYELLPNSVLLSDIRKNGFFPAASEKVEAVCNLFTRLVYNGYVKDKYKSSIQLAFQNNAEGIQDLLCHFLSPATAQHVQQLVRGAQWNEIEKSRAMIIADIRKRAKKSKLSYYLYLLAKTVKRKGLIVAFQGTDGSGKSTIINGLPSIIGNTFSGDTLKYYHWRPGFIHPEKKYTSDGQLVSNVQPHTQKPVGRFISLAKMFFYTLDYFLGYLGAVYWEAAKGHLVVFDRYYYDFYMDKIRYRLSVSDKLIRFFQLFIPKPDITFLLIGDAHQIYERKKELPVEEIQKQIDTLIKYQRFYANPVSIDVSNPIPDVLYNVSRNILDTSHKRH